MHVDQVVAVDGVLSGLTHLHAGVPQGAILSPLLFSLYMNDISSSNTAQINLFADDTSLFVTSPSASVLVEHLQVAINVVAAWFSKWLLTVNSAKSAVMVLRSARMKPVSADIFIDNEKLPLVTSHRHLGLI